MLSKKRHSSGKSVVAHLIVRMSRPWKRRLLWPAPAKETTPSRCSCRSPAGPGALTGGSFDVEQRSDTCFASTLLPHRAPRQFVSPSSPSGSRRLGALRTGGMSSNALRGATDQSLHGFAGGSSDCQGVCLWLHPSCRSARSRCFSSEFLSTPFDNGSGRAKPRTGDRSRLLRDFLPKPWRIERPRTVRVPTPRPGEARRAAACLGQTDVPIGQFGSGLSSRGSPGGTGCQP